MKSKPWCGGGPHCWSLTERPRGDGGIWSLKNVRGNVKPLACVKVLARDVHSDTGGLFRAKPPRARTHREACSALKNTAGSSGYLAMHLWFQQYLQSVFLVITRCSSSVRPSCSGSFYRKIRADCSSCFLHSEFIKKQFYSTRHLKVPILNLL